MELKTESRIYLSKKLKLSLKVLQMQNVDLVEFLKEQAEENPLFELHIPSRGGQPKEIDFENIAKSKGESLEEHLNEQLNFINLDQRLKKVIPFIIGNLDGKGYFCGNLHQLAEKFSLKLQDLKKGLEIIQKLDPPGVGGRDLREVLLIQLSRRDDVDPVLIKIVKKYHRELEKNNLEKISRELSIDMEQLKKLLLELRTLNPFPGSIFNVENTCYLEPDVIIQKTEEGLFVEINRMIPKLSLAEGYKELMSSDAGGFISKSINKIEFLNSAVARRYETLKKIAIAILKFQEEFFMNGKSLKAMKLEELSNLTGYNISTVSRACKDKYLSFEGELYPLKYFFSHKVGKGEISAKEIMGKIKEIVFLEDKKKPYTDDEIRIELEKNGIEISRRTVAKYRQKMGVPTSRIRKEI